MIANRFVGGWRRSSRRRRSRRPRVEYHRARFEVLEPRFALAVSLAPLADVTLLAGAPLNLAVNAEDPDGAISDYSIVSSHPGVTATLLDPYDNQSLRISVSFAGRPGRTDDDFSGDMVFQLFDEWASSSTWRIAALADSGGADFTPFYDGLTFHRVIQDFMIQGGDPKGNGTGGSGVKFDDQFAPQLQFTSSGILALANSGPDSNDSQFFITSAPYRFGDFRHTIIGFLTSGDDIRRKIAAVPVDGNSKPLFPVRIASAGTETNELNRVLHLSAPAGTTGTATITVQALGDGPAGDARPVLASRSFNVAIQPDTNDNRPYLDPTEPILDAKGAASNSIETVAGAPVPFRINAHDVENDPIDYAGTVDSASDDLTLTVDRSTGEATLTPLGGAVGVRTVSLGVRKPVDDGSDPSAWDRQIVPVYIRPAAPTVTLAPDSDTGFSSADGITSLNNAAGKALRFNVAGTVNGAKVEVLADGVVIGTGTASGSSMTIESDGIHKLPNGSRKLTVRQTLREQAVHVGNLEDATDLASDDSNAIFLTVDTSGPWIFPWTLPPAVEGTPYSFQLTTLRPGETVQFAITAAPAGMTVDAVTGLIAWTPGEVGGSTNPLTVRMTDLAGNVNEQSLSVYVQPGNAPPTAASQQVQVGSNGTVSIALAGDGGDPGTLQILTFTIAAGPDHGTLSDFDPATGKVKYTPAADYWGPDRFTFTVTDDDKAGLPANLTSAPGTISIQVSAVNSPPAANAQSIATDEDTPLGIALTGSDGDPEVQQMLSFAIASGPGHGTLSSLDPATGKVTYTPAANYSGSDSFTFTVTDDAAAGQPASLTSSPARVTITVHPVDDAPRFADTRPQSVLQAQRLQVTVQARDVDIPDDAIRYGLEPDAPEGMTIDPMAGEIAWSVPAEFPPGPLRIVVRATEIDSEGTIGLSSLHPVDVSVQRSVRPVDPPPENTDATPPTIPIGGPTGAIDEAAMLRWSQAWATLRAGSLRAPASGASAALPGLLPPGNHVSPPHPADRPWMEHFSAYGLHLPNFHENGTELDTGFRGGMVMNPEPTENGDQGESTGAAPSDVEQTERSSAPDPASSPKNPKQDSPPAPKQTNRSTARANDAALALMAAEDAPDAGSEGSPELDIPEEPEKPAAR